MIKKNMWKYEGIMSILAFVLNYFFLFFEAVDHGKISDGTDTKKPVPSIFLPFRLYLELNWEKKKKKKVIIFRKHKAKLFFLPGGSQSVPLCGIIPFQVQNFIFAFLELDEAYQESFLNLWRSL